MCFLKLMSQKHLMQMGHKLNLLVNSVAFTKSVLVVYFENSVNAQVYDALPDTGCRTWNMLHVCLVRRQIFENLIPIECEMAVNREYESEILKTKIYILRL